MPRTHTKRRARDVRDGFKRARDDDDDRRDDDGNRRDDDDDSRDDDDDRARNVRDGSKRARDVRDDEAMFARRGKPIFLSPSDVTCAISCEIHEIQALYYIKPGALTPPNPRGELNGPRYLEFSRKQRSRAEFSSPNLGYRGGV